MSTYIYIYIYIYIYRDVLELWLIPQLLRDKPNVFQHDAALLPIYVKVTTFLNVPLPERWIGRGGGYFLTYGFEPLDIFLCDFVKDEVYVLPVSITSSNLMDQIRTATAKTGQLLLQSAWHEVEYRLDVCRVTNGANIELA
jgi:hypothetical protein